MTILPKIIFPRNDEERLAKIERSLIRREGEIGGQLFGPVPKGRRRQFFCLDEHTWVWHEEWQDAKGQRKSITTRYDVRPNGVLKIQDGHVYQRLSRDEARNLYQTTQLYRQRVGAYYRQLLQTA
jgi:hypothetical protein